MSSVYTYPGTAGGSSSTTPFTGPNGSAAAPTFSFTNASNYGWYYDSVNSTLAASANGLEAMQIGYDTTFFKAIYGFNTPPVQGVAYSFRGLTPSLNTSTYFQFKDSAGTNILTMSDTGSVVFSGPRWNFNASGSAANCVVQVGNTTGAGLYAPTVGTLGLASNNLVALSFDASQNATFAGSIKYKDALMNTATASVTVTAAQSGSILTSSLGSQSTFTLPTASGNAGLTFTFLNIDSGATFMKIKAAGSDLIYVGTASGATPTTATTGSVTSAAVGVSVTLTNPQGTTYWVQTAGGLGGAAGTPWIVT